MEFLPPGWLDRCGSIVAFAPFSTLTAVGADGRGKICRLADV